jgi:hypothetical protein
LEAPTEGADRGEGLKGQPIGELRAEPEIGRGQCHQWRDQFLANAAKALEPAGASQRQGRLERENGRLKALVGEITLDDKEGPGARDRSDSSERATYGRLR